MIVRMVIVQNVATGMWRYGIMAGGSFIGDNQLFGSPELAYNHAQNELTWLPMSDITLAEAQGL